MDETDRHILGILRNDGRSSFVDIAKKVGLTEGAVRARLRKLYEDGTIKRFTVETKDDVKAVMLVATSRSVSTSKVSGEIEALGVGRVYEISGNFDIVCFVESESIDQVNSIVDKIREIDGVTDTSTSLVLK
jgi:DNA-binding Lrp family transcriptional regulator